MRFRRKIRWILYIAATVAVFNTIIFYMPSKFQNERKPVCISTEDTKTAVLRTRGWHTHLPTYNMSNVSIIAGQLREDKGSRHVHRLSLSGGISIKAGRLREDKVFLVIGIPTAHRKKAQYLTDSLQELTQGLNESEKQDVVVVVLATDFQKERRETVVNSIARNFRNELESGLIQVVEANTTNYPPLTNIPRLWNDKPERIRWRSKQCIDYAILFQYCSELGSFYLQLEDDISVDAGYLEVIKSFIDSNRNKAWSVLEFGARGFIGILYRASSLKRLSKYIQMYYWIWPVDILFRHFNDFNLHGNPRFARLEKPLFRHVGSYSSLDGQVRKNEDIKDIGRLHANANNPPAQVTTTITHHIGASITDTYAKSKHGFFWGQNIKLQDNVTIIFTKPESVSQVVIETGGHAAAEDIIGEATLFRSSEKEGGECGTFKEWKRYTSVAKLTALVSDEREEMLVKCLRLTVTKLRFNKTGHSRWLKIREIAVWTKSNNYDASDTILHLRTSRPNT